MLRADQEWLSKSFMKGEEKYLSDLLESGNSPGHVEWVRYYLARDDVQTELRFLAKKTVTFFRKRWPEGTAVELRLPYQGPVLHWTVDPWNRDQIVRVVLRYVCDTVRIAHLGDRHVRGRINDLKELARDKSHIVQRLQKAVNQVERVIVKHSFLETRREGPPWDGHVWCAQMKELIADFRKVNFNTWQEYGLEIHLRPGHGGAPQKVMKRYCLRTLEGFSAFVAGKRYRDRVRTLVDAAFPPKGKA